MDCLICHNPCTLQQVSICLDHSCTQNIFCSACLVNHPSYHQKPIQACRFLNCLLSKLPDEQVLQSINSEKVIGELEKNYQKSNKLFKQLKESIVSQIDIVVNQITQLYEHLHKQYSQSHTKMTMIHSQRYLIQNIYKQQTQESLQALLSEYLNQSLEQQNNLYNQSIESKTYNSSSINNSSAKKQTKSNSSSFQQLNQAHANIYKKFENIHKEVSAFNDFSQQILEKELDKSSQLMYENFESIKKFVTNCVSMSQRSKHLLKNKFLDTLQPLFQKEDQIICHKNNMPVQAMVINSKQNQLITASFDCNIIVRDLQTLAEIFSFKGHSQWIRALTIQEYSINNPFHYSNSILLSCGDDKLVQSWKLNSQNTSLFSSTSQLCQPPEPSSIPTLQNIQFQLNLKASLLCMLSSNQVAICTGPTEQHQVFIYDIQKGDLLRVLVGHKKYVRSLIYMEDKNWLCSGSDDGIIGVWNLNDVNNQNFKHRVNSSLFPVQALIYEEKNSIICAGCQDGKILVYSFMQTPKLIKIMQSSSCTQISALCKLNSNYFVAGVGKNILVYLFQTGSIVNSIYNKNSNNISIISYCPQYQKLYVGDVRGLLSSYAVLIV